MKRSSKKGVPLTGGEPKREKAGPAIVITFEGPRSAAFHARINNVIPAQLHAVAEFLRNMADQTLIQNWAQQAQQQAMDAATLARLGQNLKNQ